MYPFAVGRYGKAGDALKKCFLISIFFFAFSHFAAAKHIKGGWIQYEYVGAGTTAGSSVYKITVYLFMNCSLTGPLPAQLGIYDAGTNALALPAITTSYSLLSRPTKSYFDPCVSVPSTGAPCYAIYTSTSTVTLTDNTNGYLIAAQEANRVDGISNIVGSSSTGISFTATIPGVKNNIDYHVNTSPFFVFKDTAVICYNAPFTYQYSASDVDGDSLTFSFGDGLNGTRDISAPPYSALPYASGYSGLTPLGTRVRIDSVTGVISGIAPAANGEYVIAVYVHEWRNGVLFNSTKKELQITVGDCSLSAAALKPLYINCDNFVFTFQNETTASNITSYTWDFGVKNDATDTSTKATPVYTYKDTGNYSVKLIVSNTGGCKDSAIAPLKVYPGFTPSFSVVGNCYQSPFLFTDKSTVKYGTPSWSWDFGDSNTLTDTSTIQNPTYQYANPGNASVVLNLSSSVGCTGSFTQTAVANDKPFIKLGFTDTLICSVDSLPLIAQTNGTYQWSPNYRISNTSVLNPIVYPKDTTIYTLTVKEQGCIDSVKVKVNVLQFISVKLGIDTGICKTDSIRLRPVSDALKYRWHESASTNSINDTTLKYPLVAPKTTTTYYVTANLGFCQDSARIKINVAPYPQVNAGNDTSICFGSRILLRGTITANAFAWTAASSLLSTNTLTPVAGPSKTTNYILSVKDTSYCTKSVSDTIVIKVIPIIAVNVGKDTVVTLGQALQMKAIVADSSLRFNWTPTSFLNDASVFNPVATITSNTVDSILYSVKVTTPEGCSNTDELWVRVYKNGAEIYVPSGFTPNGDGRNDMLKPVAVGITEFDFFQVFSRWGQLLFSTTKRDIGWDGNYNGVVQPAGTYIFSTQGKDLSGKIVYRKGTVVLIR